MLNRLVLLNRDVSEAFKPELHDLFFRVLAAEEHFLHDEVSLVLDLEVWPDVWDTLTQGLDREEGWLRILSVLGDVGGQGQNYLIFDLVA